VLVRRELDSGAPLVEVPVPDLQQAAVGESGVWFLRATQADLTVTVGRLDPATGAPAGEFTYVGVGPDRTGLPFLADLVADDGGLWLIEQGTLWRYESGG
jgi:streptogramin lyase